MSKKSMPEGAEKSAAPSYFLFSYAQKAEAIAHILKYTKSRQRAGRGDNFTYNDVIFTADTETSKSGPDRFKEIRTKKKDGSVSVRREYVPQENYLVAWTVSACSPAGILCTVYGSRPSEFCSFLSDLHEALPGQKSFIWIHNLCYDYQFLRLFLYREFGFPVKQLNTKPHYPISIEFDCGIILRDSLIIAQKKLESWAEDLDVEHKKATGKWNYDLVRDQSGNFSADELEYIEHDTLALSECLEKLRQKLHKHVYSMPYTCTGILREETRKLGRRAGARDKFLRIAPCFELYQQLVQAYHGGYTHNNKYAAGWIWPDEEALAAGELPTCYDFASSYPFRMLVDKFPMSRFRKIKDHLKPEELLAYHGTTAFCFHFYAENIDLKDPENPMPVLQLSKCVHSVGAITDNGRIIAADEIDIVLTETDLEIIDSQYRYDHGECYEIWAAQKGYLPKWFRDHVYKCYVDKTMLKGGDPTDYSLAKARLNSLYGMCCQRSIRPDIREVYQTETNEDGEIIRRSGDYVTEETENAELYQKYLDNENTILNYAWGVWVTAYALKALMELGACVDPSGVWLYSDTDSVYSIGMNKMKLAAFNERQKEKLRAAGFGPVVHNGREYWPGVAELDAVYYQFKGLHAKCYACRKAEEVAPGVYEPRELKITIAGVPKKGSICLKDDLNNFHDRFVFPGEETGKLTHFYIYRNDIVTENGIERGDSVDLHACDYIIQPAQIFDFNRIISVDEIEVPTYGCEN